MPDSRFAVLWRRAERITGIGIWELDLATREIVWTEQIYRILEVDPDQCRPTHEKLIAFLAPDSRPVFAAAMQAAIDTGTPWGLDLELVTAAGRRRRVRSSGEAQELDGRRVRLTGILQDVTDRHDMRATPGTQSIEARKLAAVAENTSNAVMIADADDRIEWVNESFTRITGYAPHEAIGKRPHELLNRSDGEDDDLFRTASAQCSGGLPVVRVSLKLYRKGSLPYWADVEVRRIFGAQGNVTHNIHIHTDLTAQREALRESRRLSDSLRLAAQAARIGTAVRDLRTAEGIWDAEVFHIHDFPVAARAPSPEQVLERIHPDDRDSYREDLRALIESHSVRDCDYRVIRRDGRVVHVHARGAVERDEDGRPLRLNGIVMDVTEQLQGQQEHQRYLERLQLAVKAGGIATWERNVITGEGRWDPLLFSFYGLPPALIAPSVEQVLELIHPDDRASYRAAWERILRDDGVVAFDVRARRPDGSVIHISAHARAERRADGTPWRVVGATIDVTPLRRTEAQLRDALDRLKLATDASGIGTWERNLVTGEARWDATMFALYGLNEAVGVPSRVVEVRMVHPDDRDGVDAAWTRVQKVNHAVECEFRAIRPDGETVYLNSRGIAVRDAVGRPVRIVGATIDVTAKQVTQRQLREYDEWLRLAGTATEIGFFQVAADGGFLRIDRQIRAMYGFDPEGPTPRPEQFEAALVAEDRPLIRAARDRALRTDDAVEAEFRVRLPSGSLRHIFTRRVRRCDDNGKPVYVIGTAVDVTKSRRAQDALQLANERLRLATQTAQIGIWQRDLATQRESWDARMRQMYGVAGTYWEPTFESRLQRVHPDDRRRVAGAYGGGYQGVEHGAIEYRIVLPDGAIRNIAENFAVRRDALGHAVSLLGTNLDISDIRSAEHERDVLYDRMQLVAESIGLGVWDWDLLNGSSVWNDQMYALFGTTRAAFAGKVWSDAVHPDDTDRAQAAVAAAIESTSRLDVEFRVVLPDQQVRWIASRGRVQRDLAGNAVRMLGVNWDVTDRYAAEARLRELVERVRLTTSATGIGLWEVDFGSGGIHWDEQMYRLFGRTERELPDLGRDWLLFTHPDDRRRADAEAQRAIRDAGALDLEARAVWPDGTVRHLAHRAQVQFDRDGRPMCLLGISWDVTERVRAEAAERDKETAERANQAKSEFLSRMSHELRTPLNAILGFAQVLDLDRRNPLTPVQSERVARIQKAGWHLLTLINEVLELSRIEAGAISLSLSAVPLADTINESVELIGANAAARGIEVETHLDADAPAAVQADLTRLKQVLLNLLSNAVKYNRDGGRIEVQVGRDASDALIRVRDSGRGMSPAQLAQLFQPFNRLGVDDEVIEGTGIGLSITRRLIEQMGGRIDVTSESGRGSEFRVWLPIARAQAIASIAPDGHDEGAEAPAVVATVLYVEDNEISLQVVCEIMALRPTIRLLQAERGKAGIALAAVGQPDLALIDMRLPDMDGVELLRRLRAAPQTRDLPCVVLSANAMPSDRERALQAGFLDYWTKPIVAADFLRRLDRLLAQLRAAKSG